jgi:hypothetical protein
MMGKLIQTPVDRTLAGLQTAPRRREAGFAMLLVFLMASVVAIMLYLEIPRVALDAQRQREQLLISRGEQYKRGIQMFVKENKRWPSKIEELESLNNRRFLRRRYIDPMTGKDQWRLIHIQNNMLTDSLVTKPPGEAAKTDTYAWGGSSVGVQAGLGEAATGGGALGGVNLVNRKRASDGMAPGVGTGSDGQVTDPINPQIPGAPGAPVYPGMPQQPGTANGQTYPWPPGTVLPPGVPGQAPIQAGQYPGQVPQYPGQYPGQAGQPGQPGQYPVPIQPYPNQYPGQPGQPVNSQTGGVSPSPYQTTPGANGIPPGFQQPGNPINSGMQGNQAQLMIQQILTTPRPGGMPTNAGQQAMMGGGIAGVASKADAEGIMVYGDRTNYKEWEFIFDPNKMRVPPNPLTGAPGIPAAQMGSIGGSQVGTPVTGMGGSATGGPGFGSAPGAPGMGGPPPPPMVIAPNTIRQ